ncbi:hypothetical protein BX600DRAFT_429867 [Xylariales sp. PMI_506]|nr:hypothetical protein BX600DRAFT_429867 [Xylariales sp. PMI_506]
MPSSSGCLRTTQKSTMHKRRKLRKGTFSCWECKRRKVRCDFKQSSNTECVTCERYGVPCVRQEFLDPAENSNEVEKRIVHIETLVRQVIQQRESHQQKPQDGEHSTLHPATDDRIAQHQAPYPANLSRELQPSTMSSISGYLYSILPDASIMRSILARGRALRLPLNIIQISKERFATVAEHAEHQGQNVKFPTPNDHPIQIARQLIQLSLCLQQLDGTSGSKALDFELSVPVHDAMRQYIHIASSHVTSQNLLVNCLDGLETIMLEAIFQMNEGCLHASFFLFRRCIAIAQMIGLPDNTGCNEQHLWFCLVYADCNVSFFLGLPFAVMDDFTTSEDYFAEEIPSQGLERRHILFMRRIMRRNIRMRRHRLRPSGQYHGQPDLYNYKETLEIDYDFKKAARELPVDWWSLPILDGSLSNEEMMGNTAILLAQMHNYYLLVTLHQPYLLSEPNTSNYSYSRAVIPSASREMLSRFLVLRTFHTSPTYRGLDDKAVLTSISLLLAHIKGHRLQRTNVLEHQRPRDIALLNSTIEIMETTGSLFRHERSLSYVKLLRRLIDIEEEASRGAHCTISISNKEYDDATQASDSLELPMPYFGTITVSCQIPKNTLLTDLSHVPAESRYLAEYQSALDSSRQAEHHALNEPTIDHGLYPGNEAEALRHASLMLPCYSHLNQTAELPDLPFEETDSTFFSL